MDHAARMAAKMAAFYHVSLRELHKAPFILSAIVLGSVYFNSGPLIGRLTSFALVVQCRPR
jgi:hypothetical protein